MKKLLFWAAIILAFNAFANVHWTGKVESFKGEILKKGGNLFTAKVEKALIETQSEFVAKLILTADRLAIPVRLSRYHLEKEEITISGVLVDGSRISRDNSEENEQEIIEQIDAVQTRDNSGKSTGQFISIKTKNHQINNISSMIMVDYVLRLFEQKTVLSEEILHRLLAAGEV